MVAVVVDGVVLVRWYCRQTLPHQSNHLDLQVNCPNLQGIQTNHFGVGLDSPPAALEVLMKEDEELLVQLVWQRAHQYFRQNYHLCDVERYRPAEIDGVVDFQQTPSSDHRMIAASDSVVVVAVVVVVDSVAVVVAVVAVVVAVAVVAVVVAVAAVAVVAAAVDDDDDVAVDILG